MRPFQLFYTGDYLDQTGKPAFDDLAFDLYAPMPWIRPQFLRDQAPSPGDSTYWDRLYSLEVAAHHVRGANGIVIFRPWVKATSFAGGAEELVVIGRAGAGYDKIDVAACTDNGVVVFNAPDTLTHA